MPGNQTERETDGGETVSVVKQADSERKSAFQETLFDHDRTGDFFVWTLANAGVSVGVGYASALIHVASDTSATWTEIMALDGLPLAALFGGIGVFMFALMTFVSLMDSIHDEEADS